MFNLANRITLLRIALIPPILILLSLATPPACWAACALFAVAAVTDLLDGHIARREKMITSMGKFLDPLADKLLIVSLLIMLVDLHWIQSWIAIAIIVREMAVTGLRAMAVNEGLVLAADAYGKLKTVMQVCALFPLIVHYPFWNLNPQPFGKFLLYIALVLTIVSGIHYFLHFCRHWRENPARRGDS